MAAAVAAAAATAAAAYLLWRRIRDPNAPAPAFRARLAAYSTSSDSDGAAWLAVLSTAAELPLDSKDFAHAMDTHHPLRAMRAEFHIPKHGASQEQAYMAGNSLGLMPKSAATTVNGELDKWGAVGVGGHFEGELPWASCEDALPPLLADLIGAKDPAVEVAAMNSLTVNLHFLMAAFYRPTEGRAAILYEADAFPSDRYAVQSQVRHHGRDPDEWLIEVAPRKADALFHTDDILSAIDANEDRLALVLLGGVNYLNGQVLDMAAIGAHMHALNARRVARGLPIIPLGLDLAHAVGNVPLHLHEWQVDFASWCSYKYLNSGAGCLSAIFVHEKHATDFAAFPRLAGWWGVPLQTRFKMAHAFDGAAGASCFGVSNVNPLLVACVYSSLKLFKKAGGIEALRRKSFLLTAYLEALLTARGLLTSGASSGGAAIASAKATVRLITPADPTRRGCQLSLRIAPGTARAGPAMTMRALEEALRARGVVGDAREPDVVRLAPVPLYNTFDDVRRVVDALEACLKE